MDGSSKDSPDGDIAGESRTRRASFWRVLRVLSATAILLVGVRLAAPVLNPVFFAIVLSLLFGPIYAWLGRRGLPRPVALVIMLLGMTLLFLVIFYVLGASIARFSAGIGSYSQELNERLASVQALVNRLGITSVHLREVVQPGALAGAIGVVLSGVTVLLLVLGVDFALMWGILTFFLSFVPYVGLVCWRRLPGCSWRSSAWGGPCSSSWG